MKKSIALLCLMLCLPFLTGLMQSSVDKKKYCITANAFSEKVDLSKDVSVYDDTFVKNRASSIVSEALSFNYHNGRARLYKISNYFTRRGWNSFTKYLEKNNFISEILDNQKHILAIPNEEPTLIKKENIDGYYEIWVFEIPFTLTIQSENQAILRHERYTVTMIRDLVDSNIKPINDINAKQFMVEQLVGVTEKSETMECPTAAPPPNTIPLKLETNSPIIDWAEKAVTEIMTFSFNNREERFELNQKFFTEKGWDHFLKHQERGRTKKFFETFHVTAKANIWKNGYIIQDEDFETYHQWICEIPITVTLQTDRAKEDKRNLYITATIRREKESDELLIDNWIAYKVR